MARRKAVNAGDVTALIIFVDIRGFTGWSDTPEVFANLSGFVEGFNKLITRHFRDASVVKALGDGAMIARELTQPNPDKSETIGVTLKAIQSAESDFNTYCQDFQNSIGHETSLGLGWGITLGKVKPLQGDYVGSNVNKAARLCDEARPFGVVIDQIDFPHIPTDAPYHFYDQIRKLSGMNEVKVWVTPEILADFVPREKLKQAPEVHVAGMCVDRGASGQVRLLIAKRSADREFYPNKYEGCGGQLAADETFQDGVRRHFLKEMGIEVEVLTDLHCFYEIRETRNPIIPGIRFLCEQIDPRQPKSIRHTETRWVPEAEFRDMPTESFVGNLKGEVLELLKSYKTRSTHR